MPRVVWLTLPARYSFDTIAEVGPTVELSGTEVPASNPNPPANAKCVTATLNEATFRLSAAVVGACPPGGPGWASPVWPVISGQYTNHATARIAHWDERTDRALLGPVVMTWSDASGTHPEWKVGDGSLWLFDAATTKGSEVLRISESTGEVENTVLIAGGLWRPILGTDDDGLWMGAATNGGYASGLPGSPIYHIAVGSSSAQVVFSGGHATFWMVASGHTLWDDIGSFSSPDDRLTQEIWRFDGPGARRVFRTPSLLPFGISVIGDEAEGLWTVASQLPPGSGPSADTDTDCTGIPAVVGVSPDTGRQTIVATLPPGTAGGGFDCLAEDLGEDQGVVAAGYLYLLDDVTTPGGGYTRLFRARL